MGLSASQGRLLLLTARRSDLEYRAQQISQKRLVLSQQLEEISLEYENATSNRQMKIDLFLNDGTEDSKTKTQRQCNLTYADLISGTVNAGGPGSKISGIQGYSRTSEREYVSNTPYRLVSVDGAIVVSDEREIPKVSSEDTVTESKADLADKEKYGEYLYKPTTTTNGKEDTTEYALTAKPDSALAALIEGDEEPRDIKIDLKKGIAKFEDDDGNDLYFNIKDGSEITDDEQLKGLTYEKNPCSLYPPDAKIPMSKSITTSEDALYLEKGSDGVYSLRKGKGGSVVQRYIIDETLKYGSTDINGTSDGPNYLQDCLRNGKYLLQKGSEDKDVDEGYRWTNISWDATTNISDRYYDEDDDAAKAKYDRLQTQIQAQDKKLELELDNIETQRNAVTTEVESVEKVISEDIEGTFNAFG